LPAEPGLNADQRRAGPAQLANPLEAHPHHRDDAQPNSRTTVCRTGPVNRPGDWAPTATTSGVTTSGVARTVHLRRARSSRSSSRTAGQRAFLLTLPSLSVMPAFQHSRERHEGLEAMVGEVPVDAAGERHGRAGNISPDPGRRPMRHESDLCPLPGLWPLVHHVSDATEQARGGSLTRGSHHLVTIDTRFATNTPTVTNCCTTIARQPASFVYLRTGPGGSYPLLADPLLHRATATAPRSTVTGATRRRPGRRSSSPATAATGRPSGSAAARPGSTTHPAAAERPATWRCPTCIPSTGYGHRADAIGYI
jgi:hypothetical protein